MSIAHARFDGSIPEKYDIHLGPLFFEHYAADLARRVIVPADGSILETACGTGISTEFLRVATDRSVEIVATDLNEPMLEYARRKRGDLPNVRFEQADALDLPFDDEQFDAVVCQFGIMFVPDKPAAIRESYRVLRPGGMLAFSIWDSLDWNPVARVAHETICRFFTENPPSFLPVPFEFHQLDPVKDMLLQSAFADIEMSIVPNVIERPAARDVATGLVEGNPTIHDVVERATAPPEAVIDAVAEALANAFGDAPLRTSLQAIVVTARRRGA